MAVEIHPPGAAALGATHPLAPVLSEEIEAVRAIVAAAGRVSDATRFAYVGLVEPDKATVLGHQEGAAMRRRFRVLLLDLEAQLSRDLVVDLVTGRVIEEVGLDVTAGGQFPVLDEEFALVESLLATDERWLAALRARGLDVAEVRVAPLSAGVYAEEYPDEAGRRILRGLAFHQPHHKDSAWAHPTDGLVAYVDTLNKVVDQVIDSGAVPVPEASGNYDDPEVRGPFRTTQKPIEISQPEGSSLTLCDNDLTWERWSMRVGFDAREGLVLHQIGFEDHDRIRPIIYRASIAEMGVLRRPLTGALVAELLRHRRVPRGRARQRPRARLRLPRRHHLPGRVVADERGEPRTLPNTVCLHEEDYGILWKHTDLWSGSKEVRRQRRLVVSFFTTVGNYDYGFYWYFYLDGTIEFEAKASGVVFTSAHGGGDYAYASEIAPGLGAPYHQHLFSARFDMAVDGLANSVEEIEAVRVPQGPDNHRGNAFTTSVLPLRREGEARRDASPGTNRVWHVVNRDSRNHLGRPVSYALIPEGLPTLLADPESSIARRAGFAANHLWVTAFDPAERYSAGDFVNQHPGDAGLPTYVCADRSLDQADIVLWHTFGLTHVPRPEDWPIMPVDYPGFVLKPVGFFDRNPTLDVPPSISGDCSSGGSCHD